MKEHPFEPDWVSAPGETMAEILEDHDMTAEGFAVRLGRNASFVRDLLIGKERIDEALAADLARVLGASSDFWINRDTQYVAGCNRLGKKIGGA